MIYFFNVESDVIYNEFLQNPASLSGTADVVHKNNIQSLQSIPSKGEDSGKLYLIHTHLFTLAREWLCQSLKDYCNIFGSCLLNL